MTTILSKWGNSAGIRLPKDFIEKLSLHIGDKLIIEQKDNQIILSPEQNRLEALKSEAMRIKKSAMQEYSELEGTIEDGLNV